MLSYSDDTEDNFLPPPPTPAMLAGGSNDDPDTYQDDDLPPPPPPSVPPPITTPSITKKIDYLTAVTPKPYKSPFATPSKTPSPVHPPMSVTPSLSVYSSVSSLSRPSSFAKTSKEIDSQFDKKSSTSKIADFALTSEESHSDYVNVIPNDFKVNQIDVKKDVKPWMSNNSTGSSPVERSSSSMSDASSSDSQPKDSHWSISQHHAERRMLGAGGFSMKADDTDTFDNNESENVKAEKKDNVSVPPKKISTGKGTTAASSGSIAKMILGEKTLSNLNSNCNIEKDKKDQRVSKEISESNNYENVVPKKSTLGARDLNPDFDDPSKQVPLTFRRSDEDDDDDNVVITAKKESKSPESVKSVTFSFSKDNSDLFATNKNKIIDQYHLVRAEPYREESKPSRRYSSSNEIAKSILSQKSNCDIDKENKEEKKFDNNGLQKSVSNGVDSRRS